MSTQLECAETSLVATALRVFAEVSKSWSLTEPEQSAMLGWPGQRVGELAWTDDVDAGSAETLKRISYVLGIYRALAIMLPNQDQANGWIRRQNAAAPFRGQSALALMCSGNISDLAVVREHLDGQGLDVI